MRKRKNRTSNEGDRSRRVHAVRLDNTPLHTHNQNTSSHRSLCFALSSYPKKKRNTGATTSATITRCQPSQMRQVSPTKTFETPTSTERPQQQQVWQKTQAERGRLHLSTHEASSDGR
ncbi:unnamed protein product [Ectocarpus sp. 8 AP-2014]